jgi:hypothetical protein
VSSNQAVNADLDGQRRRLWTAVDALTLPSKLKLHREPAEAEWLRELADDPTLRVCDVAAYRAATATWGAVPCLWAQAEAALGTGSEAAEGGGRSPLRERSPADLDLMETMLTIRESMAWQLPGRGIAPRSLRMIDQMRQLAAHVVSNEPQHVEWWAYRFDQWARLLGRYLRAIETGPRPVRLRAACPMCRTRQTTIEGENGERTVVPPILIDFDNGWIRAATCIVCMTTWWRGNDLGELANLLESADPDGMMTA